MTGRRALVVGLAAVVSSALGPVAVPSASRPTASRPVAFRPVAARAAAAPADAGAPSWTMTTVAGPFRYPVAVASDAAGDLFVADAAAATVYEVRPDGSVTSVAGTGRPGYSGDGGPGAAARLNDPRAVAVDRSGNVFIADTGNDRVREVAAGSGIISTVAGSGAWGVTPDGVPAGTAALEGPDGVAVDAAGGVFFSEAAANRVREVAATRTLVTAAGVGTYGSAGDGGPAAAAQLAGPGALAFDPAGDLLVVDVGNHRVRAVTATGTIVGVAGNGRPGDGGDGGPAPAASLEGPTGVAADAAGNVVITDGPDERVREVGAATGGVIFTVAGTGSRGGGDGGPAPSSALDDPEGLAVTPSGEVVVADAGNHALRGFVPPQPGGCAARLPAGEVVGVAAPAGGGSAGGGSAGGGSAGGGSAGGGPAGGGPAGYVLAAADGAVAVFGGTPCAGSELGRPLSTPVVGVTATPDGGGYWLVTAAGGVLTFGDAAFSGSASGTRLSRPVVGMASTPDGRGYWLVSADGGVFSFGDARFFGSAGDIRLNQPVVALVPTADGGGYWLIAADGGVFTYGDAPFIGSLGGHPLRQPIVGGATVPGAVGYWLVAADGGVFTFGAAGFYGSAAAGGLGSAATGLAPTPDARGYWISSADGGVFTFGDAAFSGSAA